jgi:hypothetical protein
MKSLTLTVPTLHVMLADADSSASPLLHCEVQAGGGAGSQAFSEVRNGPILHDGQADC